jgi:hypothetical protein
MNYKDRYYIYPSMSFHFYFVIFAYLCFEYIWNSDPLMVQILWVNTSMISYSCTSHIQILDMLNKSLPHIIFNKWTFIDLMSNMMALCATWRTWYWNFINTMNSSIPILWNSIINATILLINYGFIVLHSYSHRNTFCYYWFYFW